MLEMMSGDPDSPSGGLSEEFTRQLIECRRYGESFAEGESKSEREIKS